MAYKSSTPEIIAKNARGILWRRFIDSNPSWTAITKKIPAEKLTRYSILSSIQLPTLALRNTTPMRDASIMDIEEIIIYIRLVIYLIYPKLLV